MYTEKFLQQVQRKLIEQGITNSKLRDTCIDIYEGEIEIFKIDREGGMFYASDNRFRSVVDELHEIIQPTEISTLVKNGDDLMIGLLNSINDVDKFLDSLTEDIKDTMLSAGFDSDDFKVWNAALILNPLNIEGLLETFEGAMDTLELYLIETIKGYRILTQLAYDMNPRLPGLNKQAEKN